MFTPCTKNQKRSWRLAALLALLTIGMAVGVAVAKKLTAEPREVSLYLTVEEGDKLVQRLPQKDFRLYEDGEALPFKLETPEKPISIALLVEDSQSSYGIFYDDIQSALQGFANAAAPGNWYALASFAHDLTVDVDFTKQLGRVTGAFSDLPQPLWNETDTYDAVCTMLDKMGQLPGRRVLIFVGSGFDSFSQHTFDDVQKKIQENNITIYGVGLGSYLRGMYEPYLGSMSRMTLLQAQSFTKMMAEESGGQAWFPMEQGAYPDVMRGIFQSLAAQYRLVYDSHVQEDGKFHAIKVEAFQITDDKRHDFHVRVRKGWRFEAGG